MTCMTEVAVFAFGKQLSYWKSLQSDNSLFSFLCSHVGLKNTQAEMENFKAGH
jgi:hypothetical protein